MFNVQYAQLFNWAIDPLAKVLCSIGFLFNSFWAMRDVQWDMFGSPATVHSNVSFARSFVVTRNRVFLFRSNFVQSPKKKGRGMKERPISLLQ